MYTPDLGKYRRVMEEVKRRIKVVEYLINGHHNALDRITAIESACLQVRKILELIALGSLVANKDVWSRSSRDLRKAWNATDIFKSLRAVNPKFYPQPIVEEPMSGPVKSEIRDLTEGFMTEEMFEEVYGRLGSVLHANNPLGHQTDYDYLLKEIPNWMNLIVKLLNSHLIKLVDNSDLYLIHMRGQGDGKVRGYVFERSSLH